VRGHARFFRAQVYVIGDAVTVPISSAGVRGATALRRAGLLRVEVLGVRDAVAVLVGAAAWLGAWLIDTVIILIPNPVTIRVYVIHELRAAIVLKRARLVRAIVFAVARPVAIGVGATLGYGRASLIGAVIFSVKDAIPVSVFAGAYRTAIAPGSPGCAWFFGAGVHAIGDGIPISIRAPFGHRWAGLARALVPIVGGGIPIGVGAPLGYRGAGLPRALVSVVGHAVSVSIRAAVRCFWPWLIRTHVGLTGHPVLVPVRARYGLHVDQGLAPTTLGVEGPGDEGMRACG
jgi:hypothetical protein